MVTVVLDVVSRAEVVAKCPMTVCEWPLPSANSLCSIFGIDRSIASSRAHWRYICGAISVIHVLRLRSRSGGRTVGLRLTSRPLESSHSAKMASSKVVRHLIDRCRE